MSKRKRYILTISSLLIIFIIYSRINYRGIHHLIDIYRGYIIHVGDLLSSKENNFKVVNLKTYKRYTKTYSNIPGDFIHSGNFLLYRAKRNMQVKELVRRSIRYTHFYKGYKLEKSIREYNDLNDKVIRKGSIVYIPYSLPSLLPDMKKAAKPAIIYTRGLYYTGHSIGNERILSRLDTLQKAGVNTIVFDAKDITGIVNYFSHVPDVIEYNTHAKRTIDNIDKLIRILKSRELYVIARIALFRDHLLYKKNPKLAIASKRSGGPWNEYSRELWVDPTNKFVQDYNIGLAIELAEKGVDEIQFDYIRFPTLENLKDTAYAYHFGRMSKEESITHFLKRAYREISKRNTLLSIDIFGVVAWGKRVDIRKTGQRVDLLSRYCDIISPMLYPSHFNDNFEGFTNPGDNPYYFIYNGCRRVRALSNKTIRPWLQAFSWRVSNYDEEYLINQITASNDAGALGYLFWNAANNYETVLRALRRLKTATTPQGMKRDSR